MQHLLNLLPIFFSQLSQLFFFFFNRPSVYRWSLRTGLGWRWTREQIAVDNSLRLAAARHFESCEREREPAVAGSDAARPRRTKFNYDSVKSWRSCRHADARIHSARLWCAAVECLRLTRELPRLIAIVIKNAIISIAACSDWCTRYIILRWRIEARSRISHGEKKKSTSLFAILLDLMMPCIRINSLRDVRRSSWNYIVLSDSFIFSFLYFLQCDRLASNSIRQLSVNNWKLAAYSISAVYNIQNYL